MDSDKPYGMNICHFGLKIAVFLLCCSDGVSFLSHPACQCVCAFMIITILFNQSGTHISPQGVQTANCNMCKDNNTRFVRLHRLDVEHMAGEPDASCVLSSQGPSKPATLPSRPVGSYHLNGPVISLESMGKPCGCPSGHVEFNLHLQNTDEEVWPGETLVSPFPGPFKPQCCSGATLP